MSEFIICNGARASKPYHMIINEVPVYTIEELCYFLNEHLYVLNEKFFRPDLPSWIRNELHMPVLAAQLENLYVREGTPYEAALIIFDMSGLYRLEEMNQIRSVVHDLENRTLIEKLKYRSDFLLDVGQYREALYINLELLRKQNISRMTEGLQAEICHNTGVIYSRLFLYGEALPYFKRAYSLTQSEDSRTDFYRAVWMLSESESTLKEDPDLPADEAYLRTIADEMHEIEDQIRKKQEDERIDAENEEASVLVNPEDWLEEYERSVR